ncbi:MAG: cell division protein FtsA [Chloroflexi bacterium]|nr:MAG: cell division protein FtsA [Chloroflexota bacterium]RLC95307.1 MAG: cell division protein FtsA [Chloroflexota bacterium]
MEQVLTSIDVGTSKTFTTVARIRDGRIAEVLGTGIVPSHGIHKAIVLDIEEPTAAIRESVKEAQRASGVEIKSALVGITGHHIGSFNNQATVTVSRRDHRVTQRDIDRLLRVARQVHLTEDKKIIHAIPREYYVDGEPVIGSPLGLHCYKLGMEAHVVTAGVTFIQNLLKCVQGAGVAVTDLILESLASGEAVLEDDEKESGVVMADIGAGTTDITVFKRRAIWHSRALPVGGYNVTKDVSIGLRIPFDVAEDLKIKYGSVTPDHEGPEDVNLDPAGRRSVKYEELCYIIRARIEEIISMVFSELPRAEWETWDPTALVLCGGTANLPGIQALGEEIIGQRVRVGRPRGLPEATVSFADPAYATGLGLLLWGTKYGNTTVTSPDNVLRRFFSQLARFRFSLPRLRLGFGRRARF